jgi:hypothetical protein
MLLVLFALLLFSTNSQAVDLDWEPESGAGIDDWNQSSFWCQTIGPCGLFGTPDFGDHAILRQAYSSLTLASGDVGETTDMTVSNYSTVNADGFLTVLGTLNIYGDSRVTTRNYLEELGNTKARVLTIGSAAGKGTFALGAINPNTLDVTPGTLVTGQEFSPGGGVIIGNLGDGAFAHRNGTHTIWGDLNIGVLALQFQPEYQLEEGSLSAVNQTIGYQGNGVFTHLNQATNTVTDSLILGFQQAEEGLRGLYILDVDEPGFLEVGDDVAIGYAGVGIFEHQSGRHTIADDFIMAFEPKSLGEYYLRSGSLSSADQIIGLSGTGIFDQFGSSNTLSGTMYIGAQPEGYGDYSMERNLANDGQDRFARLSSVDLSIAARGTGRFVNNETSIHTLSGMLTIGEFATGRGEYFLAGGTLTSAGQIIGGAGYAGFLQSSGTNAVAGSIVIGNAGGAATNSKYQLSGGEVTSQSITVNNDVQKAVFIHNGTATNTTGVLSLAVVGGEGLYQLNGGRLNASSITSGAGTGRFELNNGFLAVSGSIELDEFFIGTNDMSGSFYRSTNITVNEELRLGDSAGSFGSYTAGGGLLVAQNLSVGWSGGGEFTQLGSAVVDVAGEVTIGYFGSDPKSINYNLAGGALNAGTILLNRCVASATMTQTGGEAAVDSIIIRPLPDACNGTAEFNLSGGLLDVQSFSTNREEEFQFLGGVLKVGIFNGDLLNQGGTLMPFIGSTTTGSYTQQSGGVYVVSLPDTGPGSALDVASTASLGGTLKGIGENAGSNNIALGRSFDILSAEQITGDFSVINLPQLESGRVWQRDILFDAVGSTDIYRLTVVDAPEEQVFSDGFEVQ